MWISLQNIFSLLTIGCLIIKVSFEKVVILTNVKFILKCINYYHHNPSILCLNNLVWFVGILLLLPLPTVVPVYLRVLWSSQWLASLLLALVKKLRMWLKGQDLVWHLLPTLKVSIVYIWKPLASSKWYWNCQQDWAYTALMNIEQ